MRDLLILITGLTLTGCAKPVQVSKFVDPAFTQYVQVFIDKASENNYQLNAGAFERLAIEFDSSLEYPILGMCSISSRGLRIRINPVEWEKRTFILDREQLMFHELAHCVMNKPHDDRTGLALDSRINSNISIQAKISLMSSYFIGDLYGLNRAYYIKQLFNPNHVEPIYWNGSVQRPTEY